jgi:hypothetical protein
VVLDWVYAGFAGLAALSSAFEHGHDFTAFDDIRDDRHEASKCLTCLGFGASTHGWNLSLFSFDTHLWRLLS